MGACGALDKGMSVPIRRLSVCPVLNAGCTVTGYLDKLAASFLWVTYLADGGAQHAP